MTADHAPDLFVLAIDAIAFRIDAYQQIAADDNVAALALFVPFLAGVSEMLGQSIVLVASRTPLYRFILSLCVTGLLFVLAGGVWIVVTSLFVMRFGAHAVSLTGIAGIVAVSLAPRIFSFFSIAPYYGPALGRALDAWALACLVYGLRVIAGLQFWHAAACGLSGWLAFLLARAFLGHLLTPLLRRARIVAIGTPLMQSPNEIAASIINSIKSAVNPGSGQ